MIRDMTRTGPYTILNLGEGIVVIVITGGPCSGKTTGLVLLRRMLEDRGYKVLISPESATKLITAGMKPGELPWMRFQEEILRDTWDQQQRIFSIAAGYRDLGRKVVVLCDRGLMDGEAYAGAPEFKALVGQMGLTYQDICAEPYHAAIHLRTAALGAEAFYTLANNDTRKETIEQARELDQKTLEAWQRHSHPRVIDNSTDFDGKLRRLFAEICAVLGDPVPLEKEDKFLIEPIDPHDIPVKWVESFITQDYLFAPDEKGERRVRARADDGGTAYTYGIKQYVSAGVRTEREEMIPDREYRTLLTLRDPSKLTIKKRRICFFWGEQFFELDSLQEERTGVNFMEAERTDRSPELVLPPFVKVIANVTDDKRFSNAQVARRDWVMPAL